MDRRTFLKTAGIGSVSMVYGCGSTPEKHIYSLVTAPEDWVTGEATWYSTTCTECPAGCGVLAKNREGRVIKLEGNPAHPVNRGKLCIRGQAGLQSVYNPDRLTTPRLKVGSGFKPVSFGMALDILKTNMASASQDRTSGIKMLTSITSEPLHRLFSKVLEAYDSPPAARYEPFSHDALRSAHKILFTEPVLPSFHMEKADFILSFGADFIETWLSPVEYIRKFKSMHTLKHGKKGMFVHAAPYMSLTGANADKYLPLEPGTEYIAALGLLRQLLEVKTTDHLPAGFLTGLKSITAEYDPIFVEQQTGLSRDDQKRLARRMNSAVRPLVLGSQATGASKNDLALDLAVTLINQTTDPNLILYDFEKRHAVEKVMTQKETADFFKKTASGSTGVFLMYNTNPLFTFPSNKYLSDIFSRSDLFKVSFSNFLDETASECDLVFPVQLPLETWDTYESRSDCISTLQPTMGTLTKAPGAGDLFMSLFPAESPFENYYQFVEDYLFANMEGKDRLDLIQTLQRGGIYDTGQTGRSPNPALNPEAVRIFGKKLPQIAPVKKQDIKFWAVPSLRLYDGRGANKPWLNEIPDPVTNIAWETMLMVHPKTLETLGASHGDMLRIEAEDRMIEAPAYAYSGMVSGLIVMQMGQGHPSYGRYAKGFGSSPVHLLSSYPGSEFTNYLITPASVKKTQSAGKLPQTYGSRSQYKRKIALSTVLDNGNGSDHEAKAHDKESHGQEQGLAMNEFPMTLPIKQGYDKKRDVYPPHDHAGYRWGMVVDLDRCVGCSACVAACYAENNLGVVGKTQITKGREMSWLRIERYQDQNVEERLIFLPMLCQHCDNAPCEPVCPVYAPHHSKEGLNNQVYNRCIGTRFCAQNCPYKVRRFNWYDWKWPSPLNLQLNPDVTARSKGVMEKCSFCLQRIKQAHNQAKNENRRIRDGEVQPACVQTCPADALVFGSFLDENNAVTVLARDERAYQVLGYLNTKPAVIYLKKTVQTL